MLEIRRYSEEDKGAWDEFVRLSKNGTFLFRRAYMDYHSDRFKDHSLLFYNAKGNLLALLPANLATDNDGSLALHSHQGLTYGGFVLGAKATMSDVLDLFQTTIDYLWQNDIHRFYYKQMPVCYHLCPAQEDEYALWRMGATIDVCNISSAIELNNPYFAIAPEERRRRGTKRALKVEYTIKETKDIVPFWRILEANLMERHGVRPVHTVEEMKKLMAAFPDEIKCFVANKDGQSEAGAVMYLTRQTAHVQYISSSPTGKADGALDLLFTTLIDKFKVPGYRYFDFGTSNEDGGKILNQGLIAQKEGFGARGIAYKQWILNI
ncbi:MAG: GNAT family N-acetyltransferase [Prevotella sp.]|nr:GNAT family N-acetyltransferase [Prevotella sp.]